MVNFYKPRKHNINARSKPKKIRTRNACPCKDPVKPSEPDKDETRECGCNQPATAPTMPFININSPGEDAPRICGIYGEINDEMCSGVLSSLVTLADSGQYEDEDGEEAGCDPIEFYITTPGGSLYDMFAIYDMMSSIKEKGCDISTIGIGQVMSAGVLLLAAGTKGKRKVGRYCRLMMHDVKGEAHGLTRVLQESVDEIQVSKEDLVKAMLTCTKMKEKQLRKIFEQGTDYFFGAEEAIKLGIADEIIG